MKHAHSDAATASHPPAPTELTQATPLPAKAKPRGKFPHVKRAGDFL